ncbi:MAG: hypothetical protein Q4G63_08400 [Bacteroidia bacterium]|nr:hypothetical protein [Bacteroidia bacterium]
MIFHPLKLVFNLKRIILQRTVREIPVLYLVLLSVFIFAALWALLKADIAVTWKSVSIVALLQLLICTRLKYRSNKKEFLNQYPQLFATCLSVDIFFTTLPFLLLHFSFWFVAVFVAMLYVLFATKTDTVIKLKKPVLPSPFFPKSAYLWHSQFRVFLPAVWLFMVAIIIVAHIHDNFNLAMVVYCGGVLISLSAVILQKEESDFIHIYLNSKYLIRKTTTETIICTAILSLPIAALLLLLFPPQWWIILLSTASILLISLTLLWTKYIFYPSMLLVALLSVIGIFIQATLAVSVYGMVLIPFYYVGLFYFLTKRSRRYFTENERINY